MNKKFLIALVVILVAAVAGGLVYFKGGNLQGLMKKFKGVTITPPVEMETRQLDATKIKKQPLLEPTIVSGPFAGNTAVDAASGSSSMFLANFMIKASDYPSDPDENHISIEDIELRFLRDKVYLNNIKLYPLNKELDSNYGLSAIWVSDNVVKFGKSDISPEVWNNWTVAGYNTIVENNGQWYTLRADVSNETSGLLSIFFSNLNPTTNEYWGYQNNFLSHPLTEYFLLFSSASGVPVEYR